MSPADWLRFLTELADHADELALRWFRTAGLRVREKPDLSPVTEADQAIEAMARTAVRQNHPELGVLGEEEGEAPGPTEARLIIDPIDGTRNFVRGIPVFATLLAIEAGGEVVAGVASAPALGARWHAARGSGAFRDGQRMMVSCIASLERGDASGHIGYAHRFDKGCSMTGWNRQGVFALALAGAAVAGLAIATPAPPPDIIVYKTSTCGCCKKWVEHLEAAGFRVTVHDTVDMAGVAAHYGVPRRLSTCHTALVQGYVVEGHVPVDVIERLLKEGPEIAGVAVPGMPPGSPGMESETPVHYQIVTFDKSGGTAVYGVR